MKWLIAALAGVAAVFYGRKVLASAKQNESPNPEKSPGDAASAIPVSDVAKPADAKATNPSSSIGPNVVIPSKLPPNPPNPGRAFKGGELTPEMQRWAVEVRNAHFPMHSVQTRMFDGKEVLARTEWHGQTTGKDGITKNGVFWAVGLYKGTIGWD